MNKKVIKLLPKIILPMCVFMIAFAVIKNKLPYEEDYFEAMGIKSDLSSDMHRLLEEVTESLGEPTKSTVEKVGEYDCNQLYYDGLVIRFHGTGPNTSTSVMEITSSEYRFGLYRIGVGSPRWLIEFAYKSSNAGKSADTEMAYIDKGMWIQFNYDDNDRVEKITISEYYY